MKNNRKPRFNFEKLMCGDNGVEWRGLRTEKGQEKKGTGIIYVAPEAQVGSVGSFRKITAAWSGYKFLGDAEDNKN